MTPLAASISDATIWSVTFDDTRSVNYDRNSFIIQATGVKYFKIITSSGSTAVENLIHNPKSANRIPQLVPGAKYFKIMTSSGSSVV
jgi:hypothetical protein